MNFRIITALPLILLLGYGLAAQDSTEKRVKIFNLDDDHLAIQGYDPVSYFQKTGPREGKAQFSASYKGVNYRFASQENLKIFQSGPEKYEPQYGGWCAYAMADGEKVKIDPETFKIIDGRLYLFYNFYFNNTLKSWDKDEKSLKNKADLHWKELEN